MEPTEHFGIYFGYIRRLFQSWVSPFKGSSLVGGGQGACTADRAEEEEEQAAADGVRGGQTGEHAALGSLATGEPLASRPWGLGKHQVPNTIVGLLTFFNMGVVS